MKKEKSMQTKPRLTANDGKVISPVKARKYIGTYRKSQSYHKHLKKIKGGFFGKKILMKLLGQKDCIGIHYYHAHNNQKKHTIVLVGKHKSGKLMEGMFVDDGPLCPPWCD
jgi:hypothetical protein